MRPLVCHSIGQTLMKNALNCTLVLRSDSNFINACPYAFMHVRTHLCMCVQMRVRIRARVRTHARERGIERDIERRTQRDKQTDREAERERKEY